MSKKTTRKSKLFVRLLCSALCLLALGCAALFVLNGIVISTTAQQVISADEAAALEDVDCILVLGCLVKADGVPSDMLRDRLSCGLELYLKGAAPKLLMSGDHGHVDYDEVRAMKQFAIDDGVPSEDIFMDHAGFSTYESIVRAKEVFQAKKILIVTQEYHLYRALYIAQAFGLEAYGVSADLRSYSGQTGRDVREVLARIKDLATGIFRPDPTYLGNPIPITGNGEQTHDHQGDFH